MNHQDIRGYGADLPLEHRAGVPHQLDDRPSEAVPPVELTEQPRTVRFFKHALRADLTPVYGTASPPRGVSGLLRKFAYGIPEHKARHFLLLLLADRVDVVEHTLLPKLPLAAAAALATGLVLRRLK